MTKPEIKLAQRQYLNIRLTNKLHSFCSLPLATRTQIRDKPPVFRSNFQYQTSVGLDSLTTTIFYVCNIAIYCSIITHSTCSKLGKGISLNHIFLSSSRSPASTCHLSIHFVFGIVVTHSIFFFLRTYGPAFYSKRETLNTENTTLCLGGQPLALSSLLSES